MPAWLSDRRNRRGDGAGQNGSNGHELQGGGRFPPADDVRLRELRQHLGICRCSLVPAWAALLDELEGAQADPAPDPAPDPAFRSEDPAAQSVRQASGQPAARAQRPDVFRLVDTHVTITAEGHAHADVWLDVGGRPHHGHGIGETALAGRHVAVARATVDALRPVVGSDATLESMILGANQADADQVHVVVTVTAAHSRWAGTATAPPAGEESGAALAVLDAVGTRLNSDAAGPAG